VIENTEQQRGKNVALPSSCGERHPMNGIIYLVGLIVIIMAILSFIGIH
jgi:hypothetical protein